MTLRLIASQTSVVVKHPPALLLLLLLLRRRAYPAFAICIKYDQGNAQRNATTPMDGNGHERQVFSSLTRMVLPA